MTSIEFRVTVQRDPKPGERLCPTCNGVGIYLRPDAKMIETCPDCYGGYQTPCECGEWMPRGSTHRDCSTLEARRKLERQQREDREWAALEPVPWDEVEDCTEWPGNDGQPLFDSVHDAVEAIDDDRDEDQPWTPPRLVPCRWRSDLPVQSMADSLVERLEEEMMYEDWYLSDEAAVDLVRVLSEWADRHSPDFHRWEFGPGKRVDLTGYRAPR